MSKQVKSRPAGVTAADAQYAADRLARRAAYDAACDANGVNWLGTPIAAKP